MSTTKSRTHSSENDQGCCENNDGDDDDDFLVGDVRQLLINQTVNRKHDALRRSLRATSAHRPTTPHSRNKWESCEVFDSAQSGRGSKRATMTTTTKTTTKTTTLPLPLLLLSLRTPTRRLAARRQPPTDASVLVHT